MNPKDPKLIAQMAGDTSLTALAGELFNAACRYRYSYNFTWMGRPIIQFPQDIVALQEIVWAVKPDLIVETGIAHGGSLIFSASLLELIGGAGEVIGIDIDIRPHNRREIESHPLFKRITLLEGSSIDDAIAARVAERARGKKRPLVILDSNHSHEHVRRELDIYSPLVRKGSYLVVCDTVIEDMPAELCDGRPWGKGDNPKTAVHEFLGRNRRFAIDREIQDKLLLTVAPDGYLKCIAD